MPTRPARITDAHAIATVHVTSWQTSYRGIVPDELLDGLSIEKRAESRARILADADRPGFTLVALFDDAVVGFADIGESRDPDCAPGTMELYAIYLLEKFKRHGLGLELWGAIKAGLEIEAARTMIVWVLEANIPARRFYEKLGFRPDGAVKYFEHGALRLPELRLLLTF